MHIDWAVAVVVLIVLELALDIMVFYFGVKIFKKVKRRIFNPTDGWSNHIYGSEIHTVPNNDKIMHEPEDCVCNPRTEPVKREDGSMGWVVVHDALDGRK